MHNRSNILKMNINSLRVTAKIDYGKYKADYVCARLHSLYNMAEAALEKGEDALVFVFFTRWLDAIDNIKTRQEYKELKSQYVTEMNSVKIKKAEQILKSVTQKLEERDQQISKKKVLEKKDTIERMELDVTFPETPTDDPLNTENDEFISCDQLYQVMLGKDGRYLIIDIRPHSQYQESNISSDKCINIPQDHIIRGIVAKDLGKCLHKDKKASELFKRRGSRYVDMLVLLDWNTTKESLTDSNHLNVLKDLLEKWDYGTMHKRISILNGGYSEWLIRYPAHTTNPNVSQPKVIPMDDIAIEILDGLEYPVWADIEEEENIKLSQGKTNTLSKSNYVNKSSVKDIVDNGKSFNNMTFEIKDISSIESNNTINRLESFPIDNTITSQNSNMNNHQIGSNESITQNSRLINKVLQKDTIKKPLIDRSNKPVTLKAQNSDSKTVLKLMRQLYDFGKEMEKIEEKIYERECMLYDQRNTKNKNSNADEDLIADVETLSSTLQQLEKTYLQKEEEVSKYKELGNIEFTTEEEEEKRQLDIDICLAKYHRKETNTHRKRFQEPVDNKDPSNKQEECDLYKEPLKSDGSSISSGLERSYSSPNLMQIRDRKAPQVDRSSKPQIPLLNQNGSIATDVRMSHLNWGNREERLTPIHGSVHPGITGLKNLGNSCYMNSIIQCLSNTPRLSKYFIQDLYTDDLRRSNDNTSQAQVVEEFAQVIKALWRGKYKSISPHCLKAAIGQYKIQFDSYEQQDSHEFLTFLLDWMHNELKEEVRMHMKMTTAEKEWDKAMNSQRSIISDLFFGQLRSTITCSLCHKDSTTYETFNSLTMSLPHSSRCSLNDCMQRFVTGQKVLGWKCPKCQAPREATKKFDFVKLADIIVIHLNRFAESGGWLEKRNTAVDFPLTEFNLKPYLVTDDDAPTSNIRYYNYNLYAMSNHYGTMEGGHYTAFCKNATQNKWYKYDDQTVTEVSPSQIKSQTTSAYLLFYTSVSNKFI